MCEDNTNLMRTGSSALEERLIKTGNEAECVTEREKSFSAHREERKRNKKKTQDFSFMVICEILQ